MISFWRIFLLELLAAVRSRSIAFALAASVGWMFLAPLVFRGDGTAEGARELALHYSLGGVAALLAVVLLASAAGAVARERAERRLQLTLVRPVRHFVVALAKSAAYAAVGFAVLAVSAAVEAMRQDVSAPCSHVASPILPSPREEAAEMYEAYMNDPETPPEVRKAGRGVVMRLLAQRAVDHYQTIETNATVTWRFSMPRGKAVDIGEVRARLRFTNAYDMRQDVRGQLALESGEARAVGAVSNITQAVVVIPLAREGETASAAGEVALSFRNDGGSALMLRPRRDVELLVPADSFGWNLVRAVVELTAMLSLLVSFGVFLGVSLGRPVAIFTAVVTLALSEMSPSVIEQYPDALETNRVDAIGLFLTRCAAEFTHPVSALEPLARLSRDECIEPREVARVVVADFFLLPFLFSLLSGIILPRKPE